MYPFKTSYPCGRIMSLEILEDVISLNEALVKLLPSKLASVKFTISKLVPEKFTFDKFASVKRSP